MDRQWMRETLESYQKTLQELIGTGSAWTSPSGRAVAPNCEAEGRLSGRFSSASIRRLPTSTSTCDVSSTMVGPGLVARLATRCSHNYCQVITSLERKIVRRGVDEPDDSEERARQRTIDRVSHENDEPGLGRYWFRCRYQKPNGPDSIGALDVSRRANRAGGARIRWNAPQHYL